MHVKYKLRETEELVHPKGPNFSSAQTIHSVFSGTRLSFKAPRNRPVDKRLTEIIPEKHYDEDDLKRQFHCFDNDFHDTQNHLEYFDLFRRFWAFYGPWFTGTMGQLRMHITLIMPVNFDHEFSLFHPRAFEKFVGDYLTLIHGKPIDKEGNFNFTTPVKWQPLANWPTAAARLEVVPNKYAYTTTTSHQLFFTLSDQIIANVKFEPNRYPNIPKKELDKRVSEDSMLELMNNIIDSFQLTLSDEAKQQQQAALAGLEDTSLIKHYPPINWNEQAANLESETKKLNP